ncbi:uncharacterized protein BDR25DRAFT_352762 [Lindgomyces ingoldianus]|uniref:Uncharacterized protein n=1 Tax=Lindgomyces ingoldianus TaxID=673940 RepID=A0ACB6R4B3_9PLEO|nr:uncharacterized protein BDR25DRAFT_352762 [Lindgomyces ingoldianus]KAF2473352.1 hypothetical protein BDR25DRAFT_352762 [Lindgomyces ingoldianus]
MRVFREGALPVVVKSESPLQSVIQCLGITARRYHMSGSILLFRLVPWFVISHFLLLANTALEIYTYDKALCIPSPKASPFTWENIRTRFTVVKIFNCPNVLRLKKQTLELGELVLNTDGDLSCFQLAPLSIVTKPKALAGQKPLQQTETKVLSKNTSSRIEERCQVSPKLSNSQHLTSSFAWLELPNLAQVSRSLARNAAAPPQLYISHTAAQLTDRHLQVPIKSLTLDSYTAQHNHQPFPFITRRNRMSRNHTTASYA